MSRSHERLAVWRCAFLLGALAACDDTGGAQSQAPRDSTILEIPRVDGGVPCSVRRLAAGADHTCAVRDDGSLYCWGGNRAGQLAMPPPVLGQSATPVPVPAVEHGALDVSADVDRTCVRRIDESIWCWGAFNMSDPQTPTQVPLTGNASSIAAGGGQACALVSDGTSACFGPAGLVGDGTITPRASFVPVAVPGGAVALSAGATVTCALSREARIWCWGALSSGVFGPPVDLAHLDAGTALAASDHDAGASVDAAADGVHALEPTASRFGDDMNGISVGAAITCAVKRTGELVCLFPDRSPDVMLDSRAVALSAGGSHACIVRMGGDILCWGRGPALGAPPDTVVLAADAKPLRLPEGEEPVSLAAGEAHTCVRTRSGRAFCWGRNDVGQLGDGSTKDSATPVAVALPALCE